MINEEPFADGGSRMNLNACHEATEVGDEPGQQKPPVTVKKVGHSMEEKGMKPWVAQKDFKVAAGSRVTLAYHIKVFKQGNASLWSFGCYSMHQFSVCQQQQQQQQPQQRTAAGK